MQGFFGKVPSHGDFISRNLPREFLDVWDEWLQQGVAASKSELGDAWLNTYLTSPIWRFVLLPGLCGSDGWAGIVVPSVDRVGRYFPITIAASLPEAPRPFAIAAESGAWFDGAEALALRVLDEERFDADAMEAALEQIDAAALRNTVVEDAALEGAGWGLQLTGVAGGSISPLVAHELVRFQVGEYSLWWTSASDDVTAMGMVAPGLPDPQCYARFLRGSWGPAVAVEAAPEDILDIVSSEGSA